MKKYNINFVCCEGLFQIEVDTNCILKAEEYEQAITEAKTLEDKISNLFNPYFDKNKEDFLIDIIDNNYFDTVFISKFSFYDEAKGEYIKFDCGDGKSLYPILNEKCFVEVTKREFINLLKEHYKKYLKDKKFITFESVAYGVTEVTM